MPDELDLLRNADPVPAHGPHLGDGPLDHHAERRLALLLRADPPRPAAPRLPRSRLLWGLAATGVVLATALTALLGGPSPQPAVAAPRPLVVRGDSTPVPLALLADRAEAAAEGSSGLRKGTHVQSWSMGMSDDAPPVTLPQEAIVRWRPDGSHTELVVATDPRRPGRPVLSDEGDHPRLVADGHVISRQTYPPSWSDAPPEAPPPHDVARLRAYLREAAYVHTEPTAGELLDAVDILLDNWTLGGRETAALARLLAGTPGLRPVGRVTDRLGRTGQAYVHYDPRGVRRMLIMDPSTGAVLGLEMTATKAEPEYGLKVGDVMQYAAWMR
ncbi:CU044_5270 family protein [Streptomyces naphthomycinicus]|uniref:CU044_5270 family protein n=1 Tax=Streptomyces naphthomycinicus TaxID=2872625 RepID=UPI001CECCE8E|nr:CU044_5270 family protein [Streptomyces sp. TML10]